MCVWGGASRTHMIQDYTGRKTESIRICENRKWKQWGQALNPLLKVSICCPDNTTNRWPHVQIHEPVRDIPHQSNHTTPICFNSFSTWMPICLVFFILSLRLQTIFLLVNDDVLCYQLGHHPFSQNSMWSFLQTVFAMLRFRQEI